MTHCILIGAPVDEGQRRPGCLMGPAAYRTSGPGRDPGDPGPHGRGSRRRHAGPVGRPHLRQPRRPSPARNDRLDRRPAAATQDALPHGMPIIMGGDHSLALGTVAGVAAHAAAQGRAQFVIWLDAHSDFHTVATTTSGNLHGTPMAYANGQPGFDPFPPFPAPIPGENICMFGIRSVDPAELALMQPTDITVNDMRVLDEQGIVAPLRAFLDRVRAANGLLHVSLDVDFLDLDRACGRDHGARRRDLPRGASGDGAAARIGAGHIAGPGRVEPVPGRTGPDRKIDGRSGRQPDGPQGLRPPHPQQW